MQQSEWYSAVKRTERFSLCQPNQMPKQFTCINTAHSKAYVSDCGKAVFNELIKLHEREGTSCLDGLNNACAALCKNINVFLKEGYSIESLIVIGDYSLNSKMTYGITEQYLQKQLKNISNEDINAHCWLVLERNLILDPTYYLVHDGVCKPLIYDIDNPSLGLTYHPYLIGDKYLIDSKWIDV